MTLRFRFALRHLINVLAVAVAGAQYPTVQIFRVGEENDESRERLSLLLPEIMWVSHIDIIRLAACANVLEEARDFAPGDAEEQFSELADLAFFDDASYDV